MRRWDFGFQFYTNTDDGNKSTNSTSPRIRSRTTNTVPGMNGPISARRGRCWLSSDTSITRPCTPIPHQCCRDIAEASCRNLHAGSSKRLDESSPGSRSAGTRRTEARKFGRSCAVLASERGCSALILRVNDLKWVLSRPSGDTYHVGAIPRQWLTPDDVPTASAALNWTHEISTPSVAFSLWTLTTAEREHEATDRHTSATHFSEVSPLQLIQDVAIVWWWPVLEGNGTCARYRQ